MVEQSEKRLKEQELLLEKVRRQNKENQAGVSFKKRPVLNPQSILGKGVIGGQIEHPQALKDPYALYQTEVKGKLLRKTGSR